jgi:sulfofructose kinase
MVRSNSSKKIRYDCVGLGVNAVDYLCILDPYPHLDDKVDAVRSSVQGGGPVPTAMVTMAKLGAKVCYIGKVGNDPEGQLVKSQLEKGELKFLSSISTKFLHIDAREPEINILAARWAKRQNAEVCLDVGSLRDGVEEVFPYVDYLIVSRRFACGFVKSTDPLEACRKLMKRGFQTVVVTIGEDGCICGSSKGVFHSPGFRVKVVDTTGAGDVFHGAFIFGLLRKWSLKKTARFANACAAMKCRRLGGRAGIPTLKQVNSFMGHFK